MRDLFDNDKVWEDVCNQKCATCDIFPVKENCSKEALEILRAIQKDPKITKELYKALGVIQKDNEDGIEYQRIRNFAWHRVPLQDISVDIENFQNRRKPYSEYSAQGIVEAVKKWEFKWKMFTPALLWRNTDWTLYVLAGHSRYEWFKRLSWIYANDSDVQNYCTKHNCHFDDLPSLILNDIDFEDAKMVALMSNALATAETDVERASVYKQMRIMGKDKKSIEEFGRKCEKSNRSRIRSFSYLAPNGLAMDMLYAFETGEDSNYIVKRIAYWIGELRRKNLDVSDIHERELFDRLLNKWVYGKNKNKWEINKMEVFIDIVEKHIHQLKIHNEFDPNQCLNIANIKDISYIMKYYYDTMSTFRVKKNGLMQDFHMLRRKISKLRATTDISEEKRAILKTLEDKLNVSFKTINDCEDVQTATTMLFDITECTLHPDEEIAKCEEIQKAILKEIKDIEEKYYKHRDKKDFFTEEGKRVLKIKFEE